MKKIIMLLVIPVFMGLRAQAQVELKGTPSDLTQVLTGIPKIVTITGEGEIKLPAERAVVSLKISSENKSMQESLRLNQDLRNKVVGYLKTNGFSGDRILTAKFATTPRSSWYSEKTKIYRIENSLKVTVLDEKELNLVSSAVDKWSDVQYLGLDFEHSKKEDLKKEVLAKACDNAEERRKVYEQKLGVKLVPKAFSEGTGPAIRNAQVNPAGFYAGKFVDSEPVATRLTVHALSQADSETPGQAISGFGEMIFISRVSVEYAVEPK